jgi:hypothetical protein
LSLRTATFRLSNCNVEVQSRKVAALKRIIAVQSLIIEPQSRNVVALNRTFEVQRLNDAALKRINAALIRNFPLFHFKATY